jgi:hypothetical protein
MGGPLTGVSHPISLMWHRLSNPHHTRKIHTPSIELRAVERGMGYHTAKRRG